MDWLKVEQPNVLCMRDGRPYAVSQDQYEEWFTDNLSCEAISKEKYWEEIKFQLQKGKTICLRKGCKKPLVDHGPYCPVCTEFIKLEIVNSI